MGSSNLPVNYNFVLAEDLSILLTQAIRRIHEFGNTRATQRKKNLGASPCVYWFGHRRTDFDEHFTSEDKTLKGLVADVESLLSAVGRATEQAHEAARP
ncbi:hypothetical protein [Streptomyces puniciscabiei]|uniref:hypothetical protein n=1 Tax=Streptomyces puniciscabiei TaxID=164348 RepID=UPI0037BE1FA7